jgi:hypothetical protein
LHFPKAKIYENDENEKQWEHFCENSLTAFSFGEFSQNIFFAMHEITCKTGAEARSGLKNEIFCRFSKKKLFRKNEISSEYKKFCEISHFHENGKGIFV